MSIQAEEQILGAERNANRFFFRNIYLQVDDISELVPLREEMQDSFTVTCHGMWHYETGEPIGGVGSPWFQTYPEDFAGGIVRDFMLLAGQSPRKFV